MLYSYQDHKMVRNIIASNLGVVNDGLNHYRLKMTISEPSDNIDPGICIELRYYGARLGREIEGPRVDYISDLTNKIKKADKRGILSLLFHPFRKTENATILTSRFVELHHDLGKKFELISDCFNDIEAHFDFKYALEQETIQMKVSEIDSDDSKCIICCDTDVSVIFSPCKHKCLCSDCSKRLESPTCPLCRKSVEYEIKFENKQDTGEIEELFLNEAFKRNKIEKAARIYGGTAKIMTFFHMKKFMGRALI